MHGAPDLLTPLQRRREPLDSIDIFEAMLLSGESRKLARDLLSKEESRFCFTVCPFSFLDICKKGSSGLTAGVDVAGTTSGIPAASAFLDSQRDTLALFSSCSVSLTGGVDCRSSSSGVLLRDPVGDMRLLCLQDLLALLFCGVATVDTLDPSSYLVLSSVYIASLLDKVKPLAALDESA